jgi:ketosteroid isomerase-like protein
MSDADIIRRGFELFAQGDMEKLSQLFAADAVWVVPGQGPVAGPKHGWDEIVAFFGELFERSGGTLRAELDYVVAGDGHAVALNRNVATRRGESLEQRAVIAFDMANGQIRRAEQYFDDTTENDRFWA